MALNRPTLPSLITQTQQQLCARLQGTSTPATVANTLVFGLVLGQQLNISYGYADRMASNFFLSTAQGGYLDLRAYDYAIFRKQAIASAGAVTVTGSVDAALPAGTILQTQDGTLSVVTAAAGNTGSSGSVNVAVNALTGGSAGNLPTGTIMGLVSAVPGINGQATVASPGLTGGVDQESDTLLRARVLARTQSTPQGGDRQDFFNWTLGVSGVTRAWVYPNLYGAGSVAVAPVYDSRAPGSILPTGADLTNVVAALNASGPCIGEFSAFALAEDSIAVTITNLVTQNGYSTATVTANIQSSLASLFAQTTPGGAAAGSNVIQNNGTPTSGTLPQEVISAAIATSAGVFTFDLAAPVGDIVSATGHIAVLGTVTVT
jgi:uncharacterized phage protein gp47/JayE